MAVRFGGKTERGGDGWGLAGKEEVFAAGEIAMKGEFGLRRAWGGCGECEEGGFEQKLHCCRDFQVIAETKYEILSKHLLILQDGYVGRVECLWARAVGSDWAWPRLGWIKLWFRLLTWAGTMFSSKRI